MIPVSILGGAGIYFYNEGLPKGWNAATAVPNPIDEQDLITVKVTRAEITSSWITRSQVSGSIKPKRISELSFERLGRIEKIYKDKGARVEEGEVLAQLNTEIIEVQIKKLEADCEAAEAQLDEMRAGPRREVVEAARAAVAEVDAQMELAKRSLERRRGLVATDSISREDFDQAQYSLVRLEAAKNQAQKTLEDLELGTRKEKLATQTATVASIEQSIAAAKVELKQSSIRSPFAGVIVDRLVHEGVVVTPGVPAFRLIEDSAMEVDFGVPPGSVETMRPGQELKLTVREQPVRATLNTIVPRIDEDTRTVRVIASIRQEDHPKVFPGDLAKLELQREQNGQGIWLNMSVVMQGKRGLWECFVVVPSKVSGQGTVQKRPIEILHTEGERVLVRGAIEPSELLVSEAANRLTAGQTVRYEEAVKP